MRFLTAEELNLSPDIVQSVAEAKNEIVIISEGRPVALLAGIEEGSFEEALEIIQRIRALRALEQIHMESATSGRDPITDEEIQMEIDAVRMRRF